METTKLYNQRFCHKPLLIHPDRVEAILSTQVNLEATSPQAFFFFEDENREDAPYELTDEGIAILRIDKPLISGNGSFWWKYFYQNYEEISKNFSAAIDDPNVKGILFDINSPGGEAGGMFDLSDQIFAARGMKPMYAVANEDAYSAAYGIASAADKVFLPKYSGGVGSVGVISVHVERSKMNKEYGLTYTLIRGGEYKAELNTLEPLTAHAKSSVQTEVNRIYNFFVKLVSRNRDLPEEAVRKTEAQIYTADNAVNIGFADTVGKIDDALAALAVEIDKRNKGTISMSTNNGTMQTNGAPEAGAQAQGQGQAQPVQVIQPPQATQPAPVHQANTPTVNIEEIKQQAAAQERARVHAQMKEIMETCSLAGCPDRAMAFIENNANPSDVRKTLINERAQASEANPLDNKLDPKKMNPNAASSEKQPEINTGDIYSQRNQPVPRG